MIHTLLHWLFVFGYNACALIGLFTAAGLFAGFCIAWQNVKLEDRARDASEGVRRETKVLEMKRRASA